MIVGAGLAGLIAAHAFPKLPIIEASPEPRENHKALLRFRSTAVSQLINIEFKPVHVRKGIWLDGAWVQPAIDICNQYSRKVLNRISDRSIWNLDPVTRYIAPENLHQQLIDAVGHRVSWSTAANFLDGKPKISTAPLSVTLEQVGLRGTEKDDLQFRRAAIRVWRYRVKNCNVYQTVYFPTRHHNVYRASITGDVLICESIGDWEPQSDFWLTDICCAFGINSDELCAIETVSQKYGKIAPIDEGRRKQLIARLTREFNIFSLGRFATWRNLLLDDVAHDVMVVKRLMSADQYDRIIAST